ncbi:hypothetical protein [Nocardia gipuzkoensis]|uniref:hypothetical protein n=1 Tax=Nocardia gipuzkoensis TaxID=2749991 RepID=UPI0015EF1EA2|nr:hypothetical protein [Nocardia gipuzkoensis]
MIPGLHDHHLHPHAATADAASMRCGPPALLDRDALAAALAEAAGAEHGRIGHLRQKK